MRVAWFMYCLFVSLFIPALALEAENLAPTVSGYAAIGEDDIPRFARVDAKMLRGGQPTLAGFQKLKDGGVKTVINLCDTRDSIAREAAMLEKVGLRHVSIPLNVMREPSTNEIEKFLQVVRDPANLPVFVHCWQGRDRTSAMVAIYHIDVDGWRGELAYDDMLAHGFRRMLVSLSDSVFDYAEATQPNLRRPIGVVLRDMVGQDPEAAYFRRVARDAGRIAATNN